MSEIENFQVLIDLTTETPLKSYNYQIIHENSADARGIDNAILYSAENIEKISHEKIPVSLSDGSNTREILSASFLIAHTDTLHLFVNHWPSRYGGKTFTEEKREIAAQALKNTIDSIQERRNNANIMIMGDFNDEPIDPSLATILGAQMDIQDVNNYDLYNLSASDYRKEKGTIVYRDIDARWYLFDQIIVNGALLLQKRIYTEASAHIFDAPWLIKDDRPFRTYQGPIYIGGFSDHLPIFIDLYYRE